MTATRAPAGVPTGGQFTAAGHAEPTVGLDTTAPRTGAESVLDLANAFCDENSPAAADPAQVASFARAVVRHLVDGGVEPQPVDSSTSARGESTPATRADRELVAAANVVRAPLQSTSLAVQRGLVADCVIVGGTEFHRLQPNTYAHEPYAMRFQTAQPLDDDRMRRMAQLVGYAYRATVAGESLDQPVRDTPYSFVIAADTTKSSRDDLGQAMEEFERDLPALLRDGSPVRKTDRSGAGTKGTRLVEGLGEDLQFETYYDDVIDDRAPLES